jgi:hypothetical protein
VQRLPPHPCSMGHHLLVVSEAHHGIGNRSIHLGDGCAARRLRVGFGGNPLRSHPAATQQLSRLLTIPLLVKVHPADGTVKLPTTQGKLLSSLRWVSLVLQVVFAAASSGLAVWRLWAPHDYGERRNIAPALVVFFGLSLASAAALALAIAAFMGGKQHHSRTSFLWKACFDHLCCRSLTGSVLDVAHFDFLAWGTRQVAAEFRRGALAPDVFHESAYVQLAKYMCADRHGHLLLSTFMESDDRYEQEAAVAMVGYWPEHGTEEMLGQIWLLEQVAGKVSRGNVGAVALTSLHSRWCVGGAMSTVATRQPKMLQELLRLVTHPSRLQLAAARLWAGLLTKDFMPTGTLRDDLKAALERILDVHGNTVQVRTKIWSAEALVQLETPRTRLTIKQCTNINIHQEVGDNFSYFFAKEKDILDELRRGCGMAELDWKSPVDLEIKDEPAAAARAAGDNCPCCSSSSCCCC